MTEGATNMVTFACRRGTHSGAPTVGSSASAKPRVAASGCCKLGGGVNRQAVFERLLTLQPGEGFVERSGFRPYYYERVG